MADQPEDQDALQASTCAAIRSIEGEMLELKKHECDLIAQLDRLQDAIAHKRALTGNLNNSLSPVYRLPSEILLACFELAVQEWASENDGADEQAVMRQMHAEGIGRPRLDFGWSCTPAVLISHVSHHWRQLAIHTPALWTNLIITPESERHLDVFWNILHHRVNDKSITLNFHSFGPENELSSDGASLMEAIMPLIHAQKVTALTLVNSGPVLSFLRSQLADFSGPPSPSLTAFSHLTALSILSRIDDRVCFTFTHLRRLLSGTPLLKALELQHFASVTSEELADKTTIDLPKLEKLTIILPDTFACKLLDCLASPDIRQMKFLLWRPRDRLSYLFVDNDLVLKVPKFPEVENLTLSWRNSNGDPALDTTIIDAFPHITHLTMGSRIRFSDSEAKWSKLQHLTLDFTFWGDQSSPPGCFTWLPGPGDPGDHPLLISVINTPDPALQQTNDYADKRIFPHFKELQRYGKIDESSTRLDAFLRWQAAGEPTI
ncbi:hypothetical protein BJ138DRAFT_793112 [Hygrophoropsis aurantiaca]|uniref:Uncharacterized protein n=1 Tax=Hygrophoropsis aurantiaca TaxID=72124 RepID=A0ACB7ZW74_9AGAM|nr:hypothetical protein BJ138DRAFT_793112 [Hygrophoropsis aurantiaca]